MHDHRITRHRTIRNGYLRLPARLVTHARRLRLRLPANWPWRTQFLAAVDRSERYRPPGSGRGATGKNDFGRLDRPRGPLTIAQANSS